MCGRRGGFNNFFQQAEGSIARQPLILMLLSWIHVVEEDGVLFAEHRLRGEFWR